MTPLEKLRQRTCCCGPPSCSAPSDASKPAAMPVITTIACQVATNSGGYEVTLHEVVDVGAFGRLKIVINSTARGGAARGRTQAMGTALLVPVLLRLPTLKGGVSAPEIR